MQKVILGVTGGIAAYKAAELARLFVRSGSAVQVVMTPNAARFVSPLTFQALTGKPVAMHMFTDQEGAEIPHIDLLDGCDLLVIAPATANTIAKMACGIADNLLTTLYLAALCPVVVIPAMNVNMFNHDAVWQNIAHLRQRGCHVMDPESGELACGVYGKGRMPEPVDIFSYTKAVLRPDDFKGIRALVTAGPTREHFDPVRFISNPSSGQMGYSLARALSERGADVTLVSGPVGIKPPPMVKLVDVTSAEEMYNQVISLGVGMDLIIKAAAVSDFRPADKADQKVKKDDGSLTAELERTEDILLSLGQKKGSRILVGFAAETENAVEQGREKLKRKNLDLIVVNDLTEPGAGFAVKTNRVTLIDRSGVAEELPLMDKEDLAHEILNRIFPMLK